MALLTHRGTRGLFGNGIPSSTTSRAVATNAEIPTGSVVVVRCSSENPSDETGETDRHALSDSMGVEWEKVGEWSQPHDLGASDEGVTVSCWWVHLTEPLPMGTIITVTFLASTGGGAISVEEYDAEDPSNIVTLLGWAGFGAKTGGDLPTPWGVTLALAQLEAATWIGTGAHSEGAIASLVFDSSFTTDRQRHVVNGGTNSNNTSHWGQHRHISTDSETWNGTLSSHRQYAAILAAFRVEEPDPPPPVPGTRQYTRDFDSSTHQTLNAVTDRRPDAVIPDPRICTTTGPVDFEDLEEGLEVTLWRFRADGLNVYVRRHAGDRWGDENLLTTVQGSAPILELDAAFDADGRIALCAERVTGDGGTSFVWVYWYDPRIPVGETDPVGYTWWSGFPGRTPRMVNDRIPAAGGPQTCPPFIHVQLFAMEPGYGMTRRIDDEFYATRHETVVTDSPNRYLQRAFRTTDRRVSVRYVQRIRATGRYVEGRADSLPLPDSLLRRPVFANWTDPAFDVMRGLGSQGTWMASGTQTDGFTLRVHTQDACSAIEVGASPVYPSGAMPAFDAQEQVADGSGSGYSAGGHNDFSFSITYGSGSCSLVAFRARCRLTTGDLTCYSPWRYLIIPAAVFADPGEVDSAVNCDRDLLLAVTDRLAGFGAHGLMEGLRETDVSAGPDPRPFVCGDPPVGDTPGFWFVGGSRNFEPSFPFPTHITRFVWRVRGWQDFHFSDEDGTYSSTIIGDTIWSGGGSTPTLETFDWPLSTRFPTQFPDDSGLVHPLPFTDDILGMV